MLPPKLAELYGGMEKIRGETLSALSGLTDEEFSRQVGGEWSAAQILHHILMSETGVSKVIRKVIKSAAGSLPPYPADDTALQVRKLEKPLSAYQAPTAVQPENPPGKTDLLRLARETREQTAASISMLATVDPRAATFAHPLFEEAPDLYEWPVLTILMHEEAHQEQIRELLERLRG
ncbi:MAG: DinB family protein [Deltaproteobacteria bacterium]|nr:MAG: DinB family protein [Deltaproteobacteria bacterium]